MEFKNITIKGDNTNYNKSIYSQHFIYDEHQRMCWLSKEAIKLIGSNYTSFEMSWDSIPNAKSYIVLIINYDACRIFGYPFIHWIVANIKTNSLEQSANLNNKEIVQGVNSGVPTETSNSPGVKKDILPSGYKNSSFDASIGFYPLLPFGRPCLYTVKVFGLSIDEVEIDKGFFSEELYAKAQKYIVGMHEKNFWYSGE